MSSLIRFSSTVSHRFAPRHSCRCRRLAVFSRRRSPPISHVCSDLPLFYHLSPVRSPTFVPTPSSVSIFRHRYPPSSDVYSDPPLFDRVSHHLYCYRVLYKICVTLLLMQDEDKYILLSCYLRRRWFGWADVVHLYGDEEIGMWGQATAHWSWSLSGGRRPLRCAN